MKLIKKIYRLIDKKIILPITRFIVSILNSIKKVNKPFESLFKSKSAIIIVSLIIAVLIFFFVDRNGLSLEKSAEVLYNQKVEANYNTEEYVIEGLPSTVDITMIGSKANLYLAKQLSNQIVTVDLSNLKPGTHQVNLKYKQAISNVEYKLDPSTVSITISNKQSIIKEISKEIMNLDNLDKKYSVDEIKLYSITADQDEQSEEINNVIVKGTNEQIKQVAVVKALINVDEIAKSSVNNGSNTVKGVPLIAYDANGNKVDTELVPSKINAVINLESNSKEVPINIVVNNIDNIVFGKSISNVSPSINSVTIYGSSEVLEGISKIDVEIDIPKDMKSGKTFSKKINKPNGVRSMSDNTIDVDISLDDQATTEVSGVKISYRNLDKDYVVQATADSTTEVSVIISGVESVISKISSTDIEAYVDLNGLTEGEQTVKVYATGKDNRVIYKPKKTEIKLVIIKK